MALHSQGSLIFDVGGRWGKEAPLALACSGSGAILICSRCLFRQTARAWYKGITATQNELTMRVQFLLPGPLSLSRFSRPPLHADRAFDLFLRPGVLKSVFARAVRLSATATEHVCGRSLIS